MSTPIDTHRGARNTHTYLPEMGNRDEILNFAEFMRKVEGYLERSASQAALVDPEGNQRPIPIEIFRILDQVTNALAAGEGITVVPERMAMTTQQAADYLGVSRPTLVRLLERGLIPFEQPGRHRRVQLADLIAYQESFRADRRTALRELRRTSMESDVQVGDPTSVVRRSELELQ